MRPPRRLYAKRRIPPLGRHCRRSLGLEEGYDIGAFAVRKVLAARSRQELVCSGMVRLPTTRHVGLVQTVAPASDVPKA